MKAPTPGRLVAIAEHIYSLGCYTQAAELDAAAALQTELYEAFRKIQRHASCPIDDRDPVKALQFIVNVASTALAKEVQS
jgi:hypothetical protein